MSHSVIHVTSLAIMLFLKKTMENECIDDGQSKVRKIAVEEADER